MKRLLFVFNPCSGKAKVRTHLYEIIEFFTDKDYLVTVYPTRACGDGYKCVKEMNGNYDLIVCSGGDGTLNETVSGLLDSEKESPLGYIPFGSTNDFARSVGIPMELEAAMNISCCGKPFDIDVGCLNERYFVYVAGFGAFTNVSYSTPQKMKNSLGYLAYLLQGIKALSELRAYDLVMEYDNGQVKGSFIVGLVMNSFSIGGFKNPAGDVTQLNDGLFEVILIKSPQNIIELQAIIASLLSEKTNSENIVCIQTSKVNIVSEPMEWTVDGEYGGEYNAVTIYNKKRAVRILVEEDNLKASCIL